MGPGRTVGGRYRIAEKIGRGGHGEVYRAQQLPLGRDVALKLLAPDAYTGDSPERFAREASLVQTLDHPNIVRLYDFGVDDGGFPFMAFELLRGRTLEEEADKGPLSPDRVARIATQVLKALMDAHARGIVHRDIKPSNVFLVDFAGEKDFVKVLDFGVARRAEPTAQRKITNDGEIVGTPAYMAPEQVKDEPISPATDLYSLGLVIAEALTGEMVVRGRSEAEIWMKQASAAPIELPARVLASAFGPIVLRATQKDPAKRYASADEMLRAVEHAMSIGAGPTDEPVSPKTVPMAVPLTPRTNQPPHAPAPRPSHPRPPSSFWTPGVIVAVAATSIAMFLVVAIVAGLFATVRASSGSVRMDDPPSKHEKGVPADLPPVVAKATALGWREKTPPVVFDGNAVVVVTAFMFEKEPGTPLLHVHIRDFQLESSAIYDEKNEKGRTDHVVRRRGKRVIMIDDGKHGRGDAAVLADQLLE